MKSHVSFGSVNVHTHAFELGDNPSCGKGVPLTIGWDEIDNEEVSVKTYDQRRGRGSKTNFETHKPKRLSAVDRVRIAISTGSTMDNITSVHNSIKEIRKNRELNAEDPEDLDTGEDNQNENDNNNFQANSTEIKKNRQLNTNDLDTYEDNQDENDSNYRSSDNKLENNNNQTTKQKENNENYLPKKTKSRSLQQPPVMKQKKKKIQLTADQLGLEYGFSHYSSRELGIAVRKWKAQFRAGRIKFENERYNER